MYDTTHTTINTAFDCLYNVQFDEFNSLDKMEYMPSVYTEIMRYCRRLMMTTSQDIVSDDNDVISNGQIVSFDRLRQMGISASQLFKWNAPTDVIEEYILGKKAGVFVNCSGRGNLWFGPHCEYTFDSALKLYPLLNERFDAKKNVPENILSITNGTCYELNGVECNSIICLDWREICDGKIDCANGFDEKYCHELEENECNATTEYRCRSGQCIDKIFYWNGPADCMDYSDEIHFYSEQCYTDFNAICEDKQCPQLFFSCGDGFCYDGPNMIDSVCKSQRDRLYFNQMSQSKLILFPHISLIYNDTTSTAICFNKTLCPHLLNVNSTFIINSLTCRWLNTFTNQKYVHFDDMLKDVRRFVRSCSILSWPYQSSNGNSTLFQCADKVTFISNNRLSDGYEDCSNGEDEQLGLACSLNLSYRLTCDKEARCIPISLIRNGIRNCDDGSDEGWMGNVCFDELSDECRAHRRESVRYNITFMKICDNIIDQSPDRNNNTDETDCHSQEWPCDVSSSKCNLVWNCPNGSDELKCPFPNFFSNYCNNSKHFCLDIHTGHPDCLPVERAGNSIIDCIGSTDERAFCRNKHPYDYARRYRCKNSNICITPLQVCNCYQDCPENDDETIACIWLNNGQDSFCNRYQFRCRNDEYLNEETKRCDNSENCANGEDELFCDLIDKAFHMRLSTQELIEYPIVKRSVLTNSDFVIWHCNHGIHVRSIINPPGFYCLCPNEYYGDRCQFQRKRLSVTIRVKATSLLEKHLSIFKIIIMLVRNTTPTTIISHEQIWYTPLRYCLPTYLVHLLYPINESFSLSINHTVHIHVFVAQTLAHRISWQFLVPFEFLPVNRIAKELIIPDSDINAGVNKFIPSNNNNCTSCSNDSFCLGYDTDLHRDICICTLNRTGRRCLIPFNPCTEDSCYGNGECIPLDPRYSMINPYICLCHSEWHGHQCEYRKARIHISFAQNIIFASFVTAFIHLVELDYSFEPRQLIYFNRFHETQSNFTIFINNRKYIPQLVFIQLYEHAQKFDYYLLLLRRKVQSLIEINTEIHPSHRCHPIEELFNITILYQPRLQRIKNYQRLCLDQQHSNKRLICFYDDKMMCLCDETNHTICFNFETMYHGCTLNKCSGHGICIQNNEACPTNSTCICDECNYGTACQFSTAGYTLSLDAILGSHIRSDTFNITKQSSVIKISLAIISILVFIGIILNLFSISTFVQRSTHTSGSSLYLFVSSITGFMSMIMLVCKLIILLTGKHNNASCLLIEFALKWCPISCEWLNACVAIERIVAVTRATKFSNLASRRAAKYAAPGVLIFIALACSFELIFRRVIIDTYDKKAWCVLTLNSDRPTLLALYSATNILLYLTPLIINLLSCIIIIIGTFRSKQRAASRAPSIMSKQSDRRKQEWKSMKEQIKKHKHILIAAILLGLLAVPRVVITFIYVCSKLDRRPYPALIGYLVGFLPSMSVLFAFILPAQNYRRAFTLTIKRIVPERIRNTITRRRYNS